MEESPFSPKWRRRRLTGFNYADPNHVYFVTIRAKRDTRPFTDERLADAVIDCLNWLRRNRGVRIYAYCLMPDHLHLLMRLGPAGQPLGDIIGAFKRFTTRQSWPLGCTGALWQARFHDHILREGDDAEAIARYIYGNPTRKGLVEQPEEYKYSGFPDPM